MRQHGRRHAETPDMLGPNIVANLEQAMGYDLADFDRLIYNPADRRLFEYWGHAASIIPTRKRPASPRCMAS